MIDDIKMDIDGVLRQKFVIMLHFMITLPTHALPQFEANHIFIM